MANPLRENETTGWNGSGGQEVGSAEDQQEPEAQDGAAEGAGPRPTRGTAHPLTFDRRPVSAKAKALVVELVEMLEAKEQEQGRRQRRRRQRAKDDFDMMVGQFAGELVAAVDRDTRPLLPCHRNANRLLEMGISYRVFDPVFVGLIEVGLIEIVHRGSYLRFEPLEPEAGSTPSPSAASASSVVLGRGRVTRIQPQEAFRELVRRHGIKPLSAARHFPRLGPPPPVLLRGCSTWRYGAKRPGRRMGVPRTPETTRLKAEVDELNTFIRAKRIEGVEGIELTGWTRIFNQGDQPGFAWDCGGRLYARPGDATYQSLSQAERARLQIDGEAVVEIDIRASHLSILYALQGQSLASHVRVFDEHGFSTEADPYQVDDLPRAVVKSWVTITLGAGRPPRRWPRDAVTALREERGIDLKAYRLAEVGRAILDRHPILQDLDGISWAKLQFIESQAILATMLRLKRDHGIPALPVHDSLIVAQSAYWVADFLLAEELQRVTGQRPLRFKPSLPINELPQPEATPYWSFLKANLWDF